MISWIRLGIALVMLIPAFIMACTGVGVPAAMVICGIAYIIMPGKGS